MRLIDADALKQHFADMQKYERCACNFVDDGGEPATEWYCVEDALENAPTIDAIPVEWLNEIKRKCVADIQQVPMFVAIGWLVDMWEKEQEAR